MLHNPVEQVSRELWLPEEKKKCSLLFSTSSVPDFSLYCDCSSAADRMPALPTGVETLIVNDGAVKSSPFFFS